MTPASVFLSLWVVIRTRSQARPGAAAGIPKERKVFLISAASSAVSMPLSWDMRAAAIPVSYTHLTLPTIYSV